MHVNGKNVRTVKEDNSMILIITYLSSFFLLFNSFFNDAFFSKLKKCVYYITLILVYIVSTFAISSVDYEGYRIYYNEVITITNYNYDILYNLFVVTLKYFNCPFEIFYGITELLNCILLSVIINLFFTKDTDKYIFLICYLSFTFLLKDLIQIRNALALKYFFISIYFYSKNHKLKGMIFYLFAIFTHNSLFMFFPIFFIYKRIKITRLFLFITYAIFAIIYFGNGLALFFMNFINLGGRVGRYFAMLSRNFDPLSFFHFIRICIYLFFFYFFLRKDDSLLIKFFLCCVIYGYYIRVCLIDASLLSGRLSENAYPIESFLLVHILNKKSSNNLKCIKFLFCMLYCAIFIHMIFNNLDFINVYKNLIF